MLIYSFGIFLFLALLLGIFASWKKAEENHIDDKLFFDIILEGLIWGLVSARLVYVGLNFNSFGLNIVKWLWMTHYAGLSFWGGLIGLTMVIVIRVKSLNQDIYKWLDLISLGLTFGLFWGKLGELAATTNQIWRYLPLVEALFYLGLFSWLMWLEHEYRTIGWYRAGKSSAQTGFLWFWFLLWLGVENLINNWMVGGIILVIGVVGLYRRSGRSLATDWAKIFRWKKKN